MIKLITADWPAPTNIHAYTTTRRGGFSEPPFAESNMALHVGDDPTLVLHNRQQLITQLSLTQPVCWLEQQHTITVVKANHWPQPPIADACWTDKSFACVVMTADCLPVLFTDITGQKIAAAHAGWRGLLNGVLENTIQTMATDGKNIMAWLGPAIGPAAFEVDAPVRDAFIEKDAKAKTAFLPAKKAHHWLGNLYELARLRLAQAGVTACYGGDFCTYSQTELFYSYRREQKTGRMASIIWKD